MVIVLPDKIDGLAEVEQTLTAATIDTWTKAFRGKRRIIVSLPRFTFDPSVPLSLSNDLSALGMSAAFDANKADFSNISRPKQQNDRLSLSNVFHKAFVKVDEHGTEAAASTAVVTGLTAALRSEPPPPPLVFRADHPFLFLIIDKPSGLILFIGRVNDPSAI